MPRKWRLVRRLTAVLAALGAAAGAGVLIADAVAPAGDRRGDLILVGTACDDLAAQRSVVVQEPFRAVVQLHDDRTYDVRITGSITAGVAGCAFSVSPPLTGLARRTLLVNGAGYEPTGETHHVNVALPAGRATPIVLTYRGDRAVARTGLGGYRFDLAVGWGLPAATKAAGTYYGPGYTGLVGEVRLPSGTTVGTAASSPGLQVDSTRHTVVLVLPGRSAVAASGDFRFDFADAGVRRVVDLAPFVLTAALALLLGLLLGAKGRRHATPVAAPPSTRSRREPVDAGAG